MGAVLSIIEVGLRGTIVEVECHISNSLPGMVIVGAASKAVDEAKERLRAAFASGNVPLPRKRITINLAPAELPKDGASFDLAMAGAILLNAETGEDTFPDKTIFIGELSLDGGTRAVRGVIGKLLAARKLGYTHFVIPAANLLQAQLIPDISLYPVKNLKQLYLHMSKTETLPTVHTSSDIDIPSSEAMFKNDISEVVGQKRAKRALEIAAAGGHNILLSGPPGTGKSMLARSLNTILPPLNREEILTVTHLHSLSGANYEDIIAVRPFRSPHHSSSNTAVVGGGQRPLPGEISLSHHGVLFLDEFPEFARSTIEALRQPLEDGTITVARAKESVTYPADFILIATANPCPCGYFGSQQKSCQCLPNQIITYQRKLSGPILDRIDLYVEVEAVEHDRLLQANTEGETSQTIRERVARARQTQAKRYKGTNLNSSMSNQDIKQAAHLSENAEKLLNQAAQKLQLSARAYMRCIKVARTIADLAGSKEITTAHLAEALQYRRQPINQ